jgi:hypothetical protein
MTKGRKKTSPDASPKSPSLFGNFILSTNKKKPNEPPQKKSEMGEFHGSTASPVQPQNYTESPIWLHSNREYPHSGESSRTHYSPVTPPPTHWSPFTTPAPSSPMYQQQQSYHQQSYNYPPVQQPTYNYPPTYQTQPRQQAHGDAQPLPSIHEMLSTPPQQPTQQYQNIKRENDTKEIVRDPRYHTRGSSYYNPRDNTWQ